MPLPGPGGVAWGIALLALALAVAGLGELLRIAVSRWVRLFRGLDPLERALLDLYLGGLAFFSVALAGGFYPAVLVGLLLLAGVTGIALAGWSRYRGRKPILPVSLAVVRDRPWHVITVAATLALFAVEVSVASPVPTGNTFDASVLSLFTGLLLAHHSLPTTLLPVAAQSVAYPQGTTVWLGLAQTIFGLPPARTSLLVTPLFLSVVPLGGFAVGRRLLGTPSAGAALALSLAVLDPWTRGLVAGSNDFAVAVPLVLLLVAFVPEWTRPGGVSWTDAAAFGLLAGYSAAINPVGVEWLFPTLVGVAAVARPRFAGSAPGWFARWGLAVLAGLLVVSPNLLALGGGGAGPGSAGSFRWGLLVGSIDPFLFGGSQQWLSPFPILKVELAGLIFLGALVAVLTARAARPTTTFTGTLLVGGLVAGGLIALDVAGMTGAPLVSSLALVTNIAELTMLLFVLYSFLAALPLAVLLRYLEDPPTSRGRAPRPAGRWPFRRPTERWFLAAGMGALLLVPGVVVTTVALPGQLSTVYGQFAQVSTADFDLLHWASQHLPAGSRVVVAPGSAAEFLPAYDIRIVLLYPMTGPAAAGNASYTVVVRELTNGTLDAAGWSALQALGPDFVAVTQTNTVLFPAFDGAPLASAGVPRVFQEGDATLYATGSYFAAGGHPP